MSCNDLEGRLEVNSDFIKETRELSIVSQRDLTIIAIGGLASACIGYLLLSPIPSTLPFASLLNSVNTVGMTFATGLFSFLTAGLLFSSRASRLYLKDRIDTVGAKTAYFTRILHTLLITCIFTAVLTTIIFLMPVSMSYFNFFPAVLGATIVVSILLALLATSLANIVDDSRLCLILGSVSTIAIAFVAGWQTNYSRWSFSLTRHLSLFSPHNIVKALAVQFSGYQFVSTDEMLQYVGFQATIGSIAIALLVFCLVAIVLTFVGLQAMKKNSSRWSSLKGMIPGDEKWDASDAARNTPEIRHIKRSLRSQRILAAIVLCGLLVSCFIGGTTYRTYITNTTTIVHYTTPGERENIPVGSWVTFDVDVRPPFPGLFNQLTFSCHIESLGSFSGTVSFFLGILEMTVADFSLLNESSRLELTHRWLNQSSYVGFGIGEGLEESYGPYICVLKLVSDVNPLAEGNIEGHLEILQEAY